MDRDVKKYFDDKARSENILPFPKQDELDNAYAKACATARTLHQLEEQVENEGGWLKLLSELDGSGN
jgi:hypothetical protein